MQTTWSIPERRSIFWRRWSCGSPFLGFHANRLLLVLASVAGHRVKEKETAMDLVFVHVEAPDVDYNGPQILDTELRQTKTLKFVVEYGKDITQEVHD